MNVQFDMTSTDEQHHVEIKQFACCFIDIMGTAAGFMQWTDASRRMGERPCDETRAERSRILTKVLSPRLQLRQHLRPIQAGGLYPPVQDVVGKYGVTIPHAGDIRTWSFSDTVVLWLPIQKDKAGRNSLAEIYNVIHEARLFQQIAWYSGVVIRGGIAVGEGTESIDGELYGPVLGLAHHLEDKVAGYPRIVLGTSVEDLINSRCQGVSASTSNPDDRFALVMKAAISNCVHVDAADDNLMVNWARRTSNGIDHEDDFYTTMFANVDRAATEAGTSDVDLATKYARLKQSIIAQRQTASADGSRI